MQKWEYKILRVLPDDQTRLAHRTVNETQLANAGDAGWELVAVTPAADEAGAAVDLFFKRHKNEKPGEPGIREL